MRPEDAVASVRRMLAPSLAEVEVDLDEAGDLVAFVRRDLLHLDADAMNDRLAWWTARELRRDLPHASAYVSFRRATPASLDDATLDLQEAWLGLQPTLRLDLWAPPSPDELARFAARVRPFLDVVEAEGRPSGWRRVDEGAAE